MASELYVETLKGLTSGANANKVIVPAGQTLDASAGTVLPSSGQIVAYTQKENSNFVEQLSSTYVDFWTFDYTPVLSSSNVYVVWQLFIHMYNTVGADGRISMRTLVNGSQNRLNYKYGLYDYGGSGPWGKFPLMLNTVYDNTDGSTQTHRVEGKTQGAQGMEINTGISSYSSSFAYIYEVAK